MDNWRKLQDLFDRASMLQGEERKAFLDDACTDDPELRAELESLLDADSDKTLTWQPDVTGITASESLEGEELGSWRLLERIGVGGMGTVYLAERSDGVFEKQVAVKVVRRGMDTDQVVQRFAAERQILSKLDHPNISALLDGGVTPDGRPYLVMEYVDGIPITKYCDENKLSIGQRLELFQAVCQAVHHAHQNLVVHRDLKPSNILVTPDGAVKLLDFGIAKILDDAEDPQLTKTGVAMLTPAYAAPEQLTGETITTGTDVYALGVILYELLTSRRPYEARRSPEEMRQLVLSGNAPKPSTVITKIPTVPEWGKGALMSLEEVSASRSLPPTRLRQFLSGDLDTICLMAIRIDPTERYTSADDLREDVGRHLSGQPVKAQPPSAAYRVRKFVRRHRLGVAATVAVLLAFVAMVSFYTQRLAQERDTALLEQAKAQQVADFVTDLFVEADPDMTRGEEVTAREILDAGRTQIDTELAEQPELQAAMKNTLGNVYYNLGNSDAAEALLQSAFDAMDGQPGMDQLVAAEARISLALIQQDRGEYELAAEGLQYVLDIRRAELGPEHEDVREVIAAQAYLQETLSNFEEAERLHLESFRLAKVIYTEEDVALAQAYGELAGFYRTQDRREEAEELLRAGLAMMDEHHPGMHPTAAKMKRNLAGTLRNSNRLEEAEVLYLEVIAEQEQMLGMEHHELAVSLNGYSQALTMMGRNAEAIDMNKRMTAMLEALSGDTPLPNLGPAYHNLGTMLADEERWDEALDYFDRALRVLEAVGLDPGHLNWTFPRWGKADVYYNSGRFEEAEAIFREIRAVRQEILGDDHRLTQQLTASLGASLVELGRYDEAEPLLLEAYHFFTETQDATAPDRLTAARTLAGMYNDMGQPDKAAPYEALVREAEGPDDEAVEGGGEDGGEDEDDP